METFSEPKPFVDHPGFGRERERVLAEWVPENIDPPIRGLIQSFASLPFCFSLQCCCGHFLDAAEKDPETLKPLSAHGVGQVKYRIAYLALCLENGPEGRRLFSHLEQIPALNPDYIQFGSPDWFWNRHPNSFALQVEPLRFANRDSVIIEHKEALVVQKTRNMFFNRLEELVQEWQPE